MASKNYVRLNGYLPHVLKGEGTIYQYLTQATEEQLEILYRNMRQKQYLNTPARCPLDKNDELYKQLGGHLTYDQELEWLKDSIITLLKSYGYDINAVLLEKNTPSEEILQFLNNETASLWFKSSHKGTGAIYNYFYKVQNWYNAQYPLFFTSGSFHVLYETEPCIQNLEAFFTNGSSPKSQIFGAQNVLGEPSMGFNPLEAQELEQLIFAFDENKIFCPLFWRFDTRKTYAATNHLALLQIADRVWDSPSGKECLSLPKHVQYMDTNMGYASKATHVPRCGIELNLAYAGGSFALALDNTETESTILPIKANIINTPEYIRPQQGTGLKVFDGTPGFPFDQAHVVEYFDNDYQTAYQRSVEDAFYKIVVGTGKKGLPSKKYPRVSSQCLLHISGNTIPITNVSPTLIALESNCTENDLYDGVTGLTMRFSQDTAPGGTHTVGYTLPLEIEGEVNLTYAFWAKIDEPPEKGNSLVLLKAVGPSGTEFFSSSIDADGCVGVKLFAEALHDTGKKLTIGTWHFISVVYAHGSNSYHIYIDSICLPAVPIDNPIPPLEQVQVILSPEIISTGAFGLDEVRMYNLALTEAELSYLYTSKLGYTGLLHQPVFTTTKLLHPEEAVEWQSPEGGTGNKYRIAQAVILGNTINNEVLRKVPEADTRYEAVLRWQPSPKGVRVNCTSRSSGGGEWILYDDGQGNLFQDIKYDEKGSPLPRRCSGAVHYADKKVTLYPFCEDVYQQEGHLIEDEKDLEFTLTAFMDPNLDGLLVRNKIQLQVYFGDTGQTIISGADDGTGGLTGTAGLGVNWEESSIDYDIGKMKLVVQEDVTKPSVVYVTYSIKRDIVINDTIPVSVVYTTSDPDFAITEAAVVDQSGRNMIYAAFPPVYVHKPGNIIHINFIEVLH